MYFYCKHCGIETEVLPEDYFFPPAEACSQCQGLINQGWLDIAKACLSVNESVRRSTGFGPVVLPNGIKVFPVEKGWLATIMFQRNQFSASGDSQEEAVTSLTNHLQHVIPLWEWKVQHEQRILDDLRKWVNDHEGGK